MTLTKAHIVYISDQSYIDFFNSKKFLGTVANNTERDAAFATAEEGSTIFVYQSETYGDKPALFMKFGGTAHVLSSESLMIAVTNYINNTYTKTEVDDLFNARGYYGPVAALSDLDTLGALASTVVGGVAIVTDRGDGKPALYQLEDKDPDVIWNLIGDPDWATIITNLVDDVAELQSLLGGAEYWGIPVDNLTDLIAITTDPNGATRAVLDDGSGVYSVYRWDNVASKWLRHYATPLMTTATMSAILAGIIADNIPNAIYLNTDTGVLYWVDTNVNDWVSLGGTGSGDYVKTKPVFETVGGAVKGSYTPSGTVSDVLDRILYPESLPEIEAAQLLITPSPEVDEDGTYLFEKGTTITDVGIEALVLPKTNPVDLIRVKRGGVTFLEEDFSPNKTNPFAYSDTWPSLPALSNSETITIHAVDTDAGEHVKTLLIKKIAPLYLILGTPDYTNTGYSDAVVSAFVSGIGTEKYLKETVSIYEEFSGIVNKYVYFSCPSTMDAPSFFWDNFRVTDIETRTFSHTNAAGHTEDYVLYKFRYPVNGTFNIRIE